MSTRQYYETPVFPVDFFHGGPGADNSIGRSERKEMKILMHWMSRRFPA